MDNYLSARGLVTDITDPEEARNFVLALVSSASAAQQWTCENCGQIFYIHNKNKHKLNGKTCLCNPQKMSLQPTSPLKPKVSQEHKICKYLEDLGLQLKDTPWGLEASDPSKCIKQQQELGFDSRETWNLSNTIVLLLYPRLKLYYEEAKNVIDLTFYSIEFEDTLLTLEEAILRVIGDFEEYLKSDDIYYPKFTNTMMLLALIWEYLWW